MLDIDIGDTVEWRDSEGEVYKHFYVDEKTEYFNGFGYETNWRLRPWADLGYTLWVGNFNMFRKTDDVWNRGCEHFHVSFIGIAGGGYTVCAMCDTRLT